MERNQFTFYRSYRDALRALNAKDFKAVVLAICDYALDESEPCLSGVPHAVFTLIRPTLDSGRNKAANRQNKTKTKEEQNRNKSEQTSKEKEGEKEREKESENDSYCSFPPPSGPKRFVPPTLAEVQSYVAERHSPVDPQEFIDFYASKGWMVGKTPMKDWKAACRNAEKWERWNRNDSRSKVKTTADYGTEDFFNA